MPLLKAAAGRSLSSKGSGHKTYRGRLAAEKPKSLRFFCVFCGFSFFFGCFFLNFSKKTVRPPTITCLLSPQKTCHIPSEMRKKQDLSPSSKAFSTPKGPQKLLRARCRPVRVGLRLLQSRRLQIFSGGLRRGVPRGGFLARKKKQNLSKPAPPKGCFLGDFVKLKTTKRLLFGGF